MSEDKWGAVIEAVKALVDDYDEAMPLTMSASKLAAAYREATKPPIEPGFYWARLDDADSDAKVVEVCYEDGHLVVYEAGIDCEYDLETWSIIARVEPPPTTEAQASRHEETDTCD